MTTKTHLPYGITHVDVEIDAELLDFEEGDCKRDKRIRSQDVIKQALNNPQGTKRLREIVTAKKDAKIVIVVDDHTRATPTEQMLDHLIAEIGEDRKDMITLLVACGTHEHPTAEDLKKILGSYADRYRIALHDCDAKDLITVGSTTRGTPVKLNKNYVDADIKILTGDISLHYYAGFGGGRKSILPGIASRETIQKNHALLLDARARTANLRLNPVHLDMSEAASLCPPDFVLNIVAAGDGSITDAFAGDIHAVFQRGTEAAKVLLCRNIPDLFDVLIVSAGGYPKDRNLYQATKAIENCYRAVVPGGELILVAECKEGVGDAHFEEWMDRYTNYDQAADAIRTQFVLGGHKAYYMRNVMSRVNVFVVSDLDAQLLSRWGIKSYTSLDDALITIKKDKGKVGIVRKGADTLLVPPVKEYIE